MPDPTGSISTGFRVDPLEPRLLFTTLPTGFVDTTVVTGLTVPTAQTVAPDGRLFVAEKGGTLRIVQNGKLQSAPFLTLAVDTFSERGLDGVALDPKFASNGFVYVYYTTADPNNPDTRGNSAHNRLSRFSVDPNNPNQAAAGSELVLLDDIASTNGNHNGGSLVFGRDGMLYVGVGEAGVASNAQTLSNLNGKVLRLDVARPGHLIPSDNPFVQRTGARGEIWALGFRNPFTSALNPRTGQILINDVGSNGSKTREEVDALVKGGNYAWPNGEGILHKKGFVDPISAYSHAGSGGAITGGAVYTGATFPPPWQGKYFIADFSENFIRAVDPVTGAETDFATGADSPVDLDIAPDGGLYYLAISGAVHEIQTVGDIAPPVATLTSAPRLRTGGAKHYTFTVTYTDATAVNAATLDANDILINGPHGFARNATLFSAIRSGEGGSMAVTYGIKSPGAVWDAGDNGIYFVSLQKRQVRDTLGNATPAGLLGAFTVRIPACNLVTAAVQWHGASTR